MLFKSAGVFENVLFFIHTYRGGTGYLNLNLLVYYIKIGTIIVLLSLPEKGSFGEMSVHLQERHKQKTQAPAVF